MQLYIRKETNFLNLFSLYLYQIFYFLSIAIPTRTSTTMLNNNDDNEHSVLFFI